MRWKGRAGRWVHTIWSEITVSSLNHLLAAIALRGSHSFNEIIYSPWKNSFCVSLMCNIKKKKKKKSPKYWLSEVIGIHVAAISYWQSHKKAEICQANPVCALLRGLHSSVAGHVDNNKKKRIVSSEADQGLLLFIWCAITSRFVQGSVLAGSVVARCGGSISLCPCMRPAI